jgi:hypothetical protein
MEGECVGSTILFMSIEWTVPIEWNYVFHIVFFEVNGSDDCSSENDDDYLYTSIVVSFCAWK